jgi:hypothetical protein
LNRVGGQGIVHGGQRRTADVFALQLELVAEGIGNGLENEDGLLGDFRTDAVAREEG